MISRAQLLKQFAACKKELRTVAAVFPNAFDSTGRPIVAELRLVPINKGAHGIKQPGSEAC